MRHKSTNYIVKFYTDWNDDKKIYEGWLEVILEKMLKEHEASIVQKDKEMFHK